MSDDLICFLHVPKTAGVSMYEVLVEQYGRSHMLVDQTTFEFHNFWLKYREWKAPSLKVLAGHIPYGYHTVDGRVRYMTMLRDPVARTMSDYAHLKRDRYRPLHEEAARAESFAAFVETTRYRWIDNPFVRFLSGEDPAMGHVREMHLEMAKEHLDNIVVGFVEDTEAATITFAEAFDWSQAPVLPKRNTAPALCGAKDTSKQDHDAIGVVTAFDVQLYEYARAR